MSTVLQLIEAPVQELTEAELEAMSGGLFDFGNIVVQPNIGVQVGINVLSLSNILQDIGQGNISVI